MNEENASLGSRFNSDFIYKTLHVEEMTSDETCVKFNPHEWQYTVLNVKYLNKFLLERNR